MFNNTHANAVDCAMKSLILVLILSLWVEGLSKDCFANNWQCIKLIAVQDTMKYVARAKLCYCLSFMKLQIIALIVVIYTAISLILKSCDRII